MLRELLGHCRKAKKKVVGRGKNLAIKCVAEENVGLGSKKLRIVRFKVR